MSHAEACHHPEVRPDIQDGEHRCVLCGERFVLACRLEGALKDRDQYATLCAQSMPLTRILELERRLDSLTADRDQWKGRADQLSEERDEATSRLDEALKLLAAASLALDGRNVPVTQKLILDFLNGVVEKTAQDRFMSEPANPQGYYGGGVQKADPLPIVEKGENLNVSPGGYWRRIVPEDVERQEINCEHEYPPGTVHPAECSKCGKFSF